MLNSRFHKSHVRISMELQIHLIAVMHGESSKPVSFKPEVLNHRAADHYRAAQHWPLGCKDLQSKLTKIKYNKIDLAVTPYTHSFISIPWTEKTPKQIKTKNTYIVFSRCDNIADIWMHPTPNQKERLSDGIFHFFSFY